MQIRTDVGYIKGRIDSLPCKEHAEDIKTNSQKGTWPYVFGALILVGEVAYWIFK